MRLSLSSYFPSYLCYWNFQYLDTTFQYFLIFIPVIDCACNDYIGITNLNLETVGGASPFNSELAFGAILFSFFINFEQVLYGEL